MAETIRVGFDDQIFVAQDRGGVSRYIVELIHELPAFGVEPVILSRRTHNQHLASSGLVPSAPPENALAHRIRWASWRAFGASQGRVRPSTDIDLVHHTFTHPRYLSRWDGPRVVTVHDMMPEIFPEHFPLGNPHFAKRRYCAESDGIIVVSDNTRQDMLRFYGAELDEKTAVIHLGVDEVFFSAGSVPGSLPERYLLFVGVRRGYKDFDVAFEAFRRLAARDAGLAFVVVGGGPFSETETKLIDGSGLASRVHRLAPSDVELVEIYRRAEAFLFPSRYEGFGLPTLEALAAGAPTVLADASCMREVGGDVAEYFTPGDPAALAEAVGRAVASAGARRPLGQARAREFTWSATAAQTAAFYRRTLERSRASASRGQ